MQLLSMVGIETNSPRVILVVQCFFMLVFTSMTDIRVLIQLLVSIGWAVDGAVYVAQVKLKLTK